MEIPDIFDRLLPDAPDTFDRVDTEENSLDRIKGELQTLLERFDNKDRKVANGRMTDEVKTLIREEIAKIKPVQNVIERTLEKQVIKNIPMDRAVPVTVIQPVKEIIKTETKTVEVQAKDTRKLVEEKTLDELKAEFRKEIDAVRAQFEQMRETLPFMGGGSGVIGIPPPEGNENKTLKVVKNKAVWSTAGGGSSSDAYTPTSVTTTRTFNATLTSLDELANVLGSLIASLQGAGVIL